MKKIKLILILTSFLLPSFLFSQQVKVSSGKVQRLENFKSALVASRHVDIWLPEGYSNKKKYAVLYMHDGQMLFDSTTTWNKQEWGIDETVARLVKEKKIKDCIVVGVWNSGNLRQAEYFPQKVLNYLSKEMQDSLYLHKKTSQGNFLSNKVQSDNYLRFLVEELKPYVDKNFSTHPDRAHTFVAGSSMGGLISMYAICEYPDVFGGAACISTHWPGGYQIPDNPVPDAFMNYLKEKLPDPQNHKIYFDYGTATLDALYPPFQKQADEVMKSKGFSEKNWITQEFTGEDHTEKAWRKRFHIPLLFLMGK